MNRRLNFRNAPFFEAIAAQGIGVGETFRAITRETVEYTFKKFNLDKKVKDFDAMLSLIDSNLSEALREVGTAPWLRIKNAKRVDELPLNLDVPSTDRVGHLYNVMRKEIEDLFSDVRPLGDYRGLLAQGEFSREMFDEAGFVSRVYGTNVSLLLEKRNKYTDEVQAATKLLEACPPGDE